jgi:hypothetical protein
MKFLIRLNKNNWNIIKQKKKMLPLSFISAVGNNVVREKAMKI